MPFTLSHPLFAAPLKKIIPSLSVTGLVLGSMAPDIEYFFAMQPYRSIGHDITGFFLLGLPTCIAFAFAFHRIIKPFLPSMMPSILHIDQFTAHRIQPWRLSTGLEWILFILSIWIGFLSHLFMDNWTHGSGWFVQRLPFLQSYIAGDQVYHILQLSLSVLGALIPGLYFMYHWKKWRSTIDVKSRTASSIRHNQWQSWLILCFTSILLLSKLLLSGNYFSISIWVVAPITSFFLGVFLTAMLTMAYRSNRLAVGVLFAFVLYLVIALYKFSQHLMVNELLLWVIYTWVLSAVLLFSTLICSPKQKFQ